MPVHRTVSALALAAVLTGSGYAASAPHQSTHAPQGCIATGNGFLRARIRGALDLDINWNNAELECDGSVRPDGSGIRLSFAGPLRSNGRRVRMVFGVAHALEGVSARALPTNLTIIFEGENRVFATLGDDRCTVDELRQERIGTPGGRVRPYRVIARGFCIEPAAAMDRDERIVVSRFDFAGRVTFEDVPPVRGHPAMPDTLRT